LRSIRDIVTRRPPHLRHLVDAEQGILTGKRYLIHDRDPLFTAEFLAMIADAGVESVKLPPRSPNLNAYAERFVRSIKECCLDRMIFFGEQSLRTVIQTFAATITTWFCNGLNDGLAASSKATTSPSRSWRRC
jgi:transposase InsO family protein